MNATHLFGRPDRGFHNSESWWTTFFTLYILHEAHSRTLPSIRVCTHDKNGNFRWIDEQLALSEATFYNLVVEAPLSGVPFGLTSLPNEYRGIKPDISFIRKEKLSATFIEVKTIGASVAGNIDLYKNLCQYLCEHGRKAEVYYLISCGHERDWDIITTHNCKIILWEHIFDLMQQCSLTRTLGVNLEKYSLLPKELTDHQSISAQ